MFNSPNPITFHDDEVAVYVGNLDDIRAGTATPWVQQVVKVRGYDKTGHALVIDQAGGLTPAVDLPGFFGVFRAGFYGWRETESYVQPETAPQIVLDGQNDGSGTLGSKATV
jgi:hypothetical protein